MTADESTLTVEEPESLEEPGQEPGEAPDDQPVEDSAEPEAPSAGDSDAAEQPDDETPPEVLEEEPVPDAETPSTPFSFKVDGVTVDVEGASESDGTITIPRDTWERVVSPRLVDRRVIHARDQKRLARIRELEEGKTEKEQRAEVVLARVDELMSDPVKLRAFAENYQAEAPRLKLEIENELLKSRTKGYETERQTEAQRAEQREFEEAIGPTFTKAAELMLSEHEGTTVKAEDLAKQLQGFHEAGIDLFFDVREGDGSGLDPREYKRGLDLQRVRTLLTPMFDKAELSAKLEAARQAEKIKAANATAVGKKPPPTASAKGAPAGEVVTEVTTREEFQESMKKKYPWLPQAKTS